MTTGRTVVLLLLVLLLFPAFPGTARAQEDAQRDQLLEQKRALNHRIAALRREQDFLLFEKTMDTVDSKYLLLDTKTKVGQLRYKNRVLREFRFTPGSGIPEQGRQVLTEKIEGPRRKYALVFGTGLVLESRGGAAYRVANTPRVSLPRKDFTAVYYALENGALAYVVP